MFKARGRSHDDKPVIILGLSHENLRRLKAGQPICFSLEELGLEGEVLICAGETEETIARELLGAARADGVDVHEGGPPPASMARRKL